MNSSRSLSSLFHISLISCWCFSSSSTLLISRCWFSSKFSLAHFSARSCCLMRISCSARSSDVVKMAATRRSWWRLRRRISVFLHFTLPIQSNNETQLPFLSKFDKICDATMFRFVISSIDSIFAWFELNFFVPIAVDSRFQNGGPFFVSVLFLLFRLYDLGLVEVKMRRSAFLMQNWLPIKRRLFTSTHLNLCLICEDFLKSDFHNCRALVSYSFFFSFVSISLFAFTLLRCWLNEAQRRNDSNMAEIALFIPSACSGLCAE